jgi:hypothetical protein
MREAQAVDVRRPLQMFKSEAASFELPSVIEIGLTYQRTIAENLSGVVSGSFTNNNLFLDEYRIGGELGYKLETVQVFGRAGLSVIPKDQNAEQENVFGACFGGGLSTTAAGIEVTIDYAYRSANFFDGNQVFSVKFGF